MLFRMTHRFLTDVSPSIFDESTAPDWLTSAKTIPGSTMDNRWFWRDKVLTLKVGEYVNTDFQRIVRIS